MFTPPRQGAWLSDGSTSIGEIVASLGYDFVVLDIEHGAFDTTTLDRFIPLLKGLGLEVLSKVVVPERWALQQALDFGSDGVIIPHIEGIEHASLVTDYAKLPPLGSRSLAGGRTMGYYTGFDDAWISAHNRDVKIFPMIEHPGALHDVAQIAALPTVDGLFIGPGDLAAMSGRGAYRRTPADFADFRAIASAAKANGKPWVMPAWSPVEKEFAITEGAGYALLAMQHPVIAEGYGAARRLMDELIAKRGGSGSAAESAY